MMKTLTNILAITIFVVLIVTSAYGLYWGGKYLWGHLVSFDIQTRLILLAAISTILLIWLVITSGHKTALRHQIREHLTEDRYKLYRELLAHYYAAIADAHAASHTPAFAHESDIMLLATVPVIDAHAKLATALQDPASSAGGVEEGLAELIKAMRRDLGHGDNHTPVLTAERQPLEHDNTTRIVAS